MQYWTQLRDIQTDILDQLRQVHPDNAANCTTDVVNVKELEGAFSSVKSMRTLEALYARLRQQLAVTSPPYRSYRVANNGSRYVSHTTSMFGFIASEYLYEQLPIVPDEIVTWLPEVVAEYTTFNAQICDRNTCITPLAMFQTKGHGNFLPLTVPFSHAVVGRT